jgi:hypothetical protein
VNGLYRGAYIVVIQHTIGGQLFYDIGYIKNGKGTMSEPWQICSLLSWKQYPVSAKEIIKDSYYLNGNLSEAEVIYKNIVGKDPVYATRPNSSDIKIAMLVFN